MLLGFLHGFFCHPCGNQFPDLGMASLNWISGGAFLFKFRTLPAHPARGKKCTGASHQLSDATKLVTKICFVSKICTWQCCAVL